MGKILTIHLKNSQAPIVIKDDNEMRNIFELSETIKQMMNMKSDISFSTDSQFLIIDRYSISAINIQDSENIRPSKFENTVDRTKLLNDLNDLLESDAPIENTIDTPKNDNIIFELNEENLVGLSDDVEDYNIIKDPINTPTYIAADDDSNSIVSAVSEIGNIISESTKSPAPKKGRPKKIITPTDGE